MIVVCVVVRVMCLSTIRSLCSTPSADLVHKHIQPPSHPTPALSTKTRTHPQTPDPRPFLRRCLRNTETKKCEKTNEKAQHCARQQTESERKSPEQYYK